MTDRAPYAYAILRVIPQIERGECVNAGVVLYCRSLRFLGVRTGLDAGRLLALAPHADLEGVRRHLRALELIAAGEAEGGRIATLPPHERFGWLTAPASTIVQPGPVHGGCCADPAAALDALYERLVAPPAG
ncbi:MAG: DUF3037 domain-containing protein [Thermomicrobiales bacterium]